MRPEYIDIDSEPKQAPAADIFGIFSKYSVTRKFSSVKQQQKTDCYVYCPALPYIIGLI